MNKIRLTFFLFTLLVLPWTLGAEVLKSSNFQVLDPVISVPGVRSTSANFTLLEALFQFALGTSTAASFQLNPGFLAFPAVTLPTVTATAGDGAVSLSWTSAVGAVGWTVSGYTVGQSTTSGGPYTYASVGNVTSSTRSGLNNDSEYFFIVLPEDVFGNTIATSTQVNVTPVAALVPSAPPSTGGGGPLFTEGIQGPQQFQGAEVVFRGEAQPRGHVQLLQDSFIVARTEVSTSGQFELFVRGLSDGIHTFNLTGEDINGRRTSAVSVTVDATAERTVAIQDILLPPTLSTDIQEVRQGDSLVFSGYGVLNAEIIVFLNSDEQNVETIVQTTRTDSLGAYTVFFDTNVLPLGSYTARAIAVKNGIVSLSSLPVSVSVGVQTVLKESADCPAFGDMNQDCRVNLVDFSIVAFYYERPLDNAGKNKEITYLNGDGIVNLTDFSLLAYYWTG